MSEESEGKLFFAAAVRWEVLRSRLIDELKNLELTSINIQFSTKSETDLRKRLATISELLDKLKDTLGPPSKLPTNVA